MKLKYRSMISFFKLSEINIIEDSIKNKKKFDCINVEGQLDEKRTIVSFNKNINIRYKKSRLLNLELHLKDNIDSRLEVFQQMKLDKNKLRDARLDIT